MPRQLQRFAGVAHIAGLDLVDLQVAVQEIADVEIFALRTEDCAFGETPRFYGADLADTPSLRRQNVEERIGRGKPSLFGRPATAIQCDRDVHLPGVFTLGRGNMG